jgi:type VI secretion system protein ImpK
MKPMTKYNKSDGVDETILRSVPENYDMQETMILPSPDKTLVLKQKEPSFKKVFKSNPFYTQASSLFYLVPKIRMQSTYDNVKELNLHMVETLKKIETTDSKKGISQKQNKIASYFLSALLDETVLNTPWGRKSNWDEFSLLRSLHGDGQEGKKFFIILKHLLQNAKHNIHLIELAYICLSLGYEGVFGLKENGSSIIAQHQQKLCELIQQINSPDDDALSTDWQGIRSIRKSMMPEIPLWVSLVISGLVLMLVYFGVIYLINRNSDKVSQRLDHISPKNTALPTPPQIIQHPTAAPPIAAPPQREAKEASDETIQDIFAIDKLEEALQFEIEQKRVQVLDGPTLRLINVFHSGSDQVKDVFIPLLEKIGKFLSDYNVRILVIGHTDNRPIFSGRFPSNWHLSEARAKSVATRLAQTDKLLERIRYEGHGADDPVSANDTEENRALNRRVDIHIR